MGEKHKKNRKNKSSGDGDDDDYQAEPAVKWYSQISEGPPDDKPVTDQVMIEMKEEAKKCFDANASTYNFKNMKSNSNYQWMKTVMSKGTVSDKVAAYTVTIQDSPVSNLETLRSLVGMVKVGKKREYIVVIDTLTELFIDSLLPPNRKLKPFHQQPLASLDKLTSGNIVTRKKYLSYWYYEGELKEVYTSFVLALSKAAHDTVDTNKEKAISAMYRLLAGHPEQEKNLLTYIINKLGDPSQKVCSKAIYCLTQLLRKHPNMQGVVLREVEKLLFRQNVATRAQYYGLCFLSQFYLYHEDIEVARHLIEVYFSFFKACVKKGEVDSRMMSVLLMGVNRAYPYAKLEMDKVSEHIDTMYRVVHAASFNVSVHTLALLYQVSDYSNNVNDRFFSALYKKLLDPNVTQTAHQAMFLSLVYKALSKDTQIDRVKVFIKRLLQIAQSVQPSLACGTLYLVSQLVGRKKALAAAVFKNPDTTKSYENNEDNDEEKLAEVSKPEDDTIKINCEGTENLVENESATPASVHPDKVKKEKPDRKEIGYNGLHRNPLYAGGNFCVYSELTVLQKHFHPTVRLFTENVMKCEVIKYTGDPLKDFTLIRFLERFVFKNPKHAIDPAKQGFHPTFGKRKAYVPVGIRSIPVNSAGYLNEKAQNIPADEMFLYAYLQNKYADRQQVKEEDDSDLESVASEEFEEMLDKMGASGGKEDDEELDFMAAVGENTSKLSKKKKITPDEEPEDDDDDEEEEDDGENEIESDSEDDFEDQNAKDQALEDDLMEEGDEELMNVSDDEDSDIVFDSDDDDPKASKKSKSNKLDLKGDIQSMFASADEFAMLLEDEGNSGTKPGSSSAFENKDNAAVKQLAWEEKRNQWLSGYQPSDKRKKFGKGKPGKKFDRKRTNNGQPGNKSKKFKKK